VRDAAFGCNWVGTAISFQRSLMFILGTANKEFNLTAGKFVPVSNLTMMNVCMYVRMYVCMNICKYVCMYECISEYTYKQMYVYIYIYIYINMRNYICINIRMNILVYYTYEYVCRYVRKYVSVGKFLSLYVLTQIRNKKVIKSKNINHYENDFIRERRNTNTSRSTN